MDSESNAVCVGEPPSDWQDDYLNADPNTEPPLGNYEARKKDVMRYYYPEEFVESLGEQQRQTPQSSQASSLFTIDASVSQSLRFPIGVENQQPEEALTNPNEERKKKKKEKKEKKKKKKRRREENERDSEQDRGDGRRSCESSPSDD